MRGTVIEAKEAVVPVIVDDDEQHTWEIDAVVDTGFTAELTLPPEAVDALGLTSVGWEPVTLAGGLVVERLLYEARIIWNEPYAPSESCSSIRSPSSAWASSRTITSASTSPTAAKSQSRPSLTPDS